MNSTPAGDDAFRLLRDAFIRVKSFDMSQFSQVVPSEDNLRQKATEEVSFERLIVDENGLTSGMKLFAVHPLLDVLASWKHTLSLFQGAIQPFTRDIEAVERLDREVVDLRMRRSAVKDSIERNAESDGNYIAAKERNIEAQAHFNELKDREGRRRANLAAYTLWYKIALFLILSAEILINYETFLFFLGIPAIAFGTTLVMGALMAFAAHQHGKFLRQTSALVGEHKSRSERQSEWRAFGFATFSLVLVVATAGASRYEYAIHIASSQAVVTLLGPDSHIEVNPMKDVSLSLMGNVAAWAVGVFLSYFCHDKNPDYADAAHEARIRERAYRKQRLPFDERIRTEEAQIEKEIVERERAASVRAASVDEQRSMLKQAAIAETAIYDACFISLRRGVEQYRSSILQACVGKPQTTIMQGERSLTPFDYQALKLTFDRETLERLGQ